MGSAPKRPLVGWIVGAFEPGSAGPSRGIRSSFFELVEQFNLFTQYAIHECTTDAAGLQLRRMLIDGVFKVLSAQLIHWGKAHVTLKKRRLLLRQSS